MVAGGGQGQRRAVCGAGCPLRMCRSGGGLRSNVGPDFECMPPAPAPTPPCRRAKIFRRDQGGVRDLAGMKALMRGNNWRKDPVGALGVCLCVGVGGGMGGRGLYPLSPRRAEGGWVRKHVWDERRRPLPCNYSSQLCCRTSDAAWHLTPRLPAQPPTHTHTHRPALPCPCAVLRGPPHLRRVRPRRPRPRRPRGPRLLRHKGHELPPGAGHAGACAQGCSCGCEVGCEGVRVRVGVCACAQRGRGAAAGGQGSTGGRGGCSRRLALLLGRLHACWQRVASIRPGPLPATTAPCKLHACTPVHLHPPAPVVFFCCRPRLSTAPPPPTTAAAPGPGGRTGADPRRYPASAGASWWSQT